MQITESQDNLPQKILQFSIILIFLVLALFIFISSYSLLKSEIPTTGSTISLPKAPALITLAEVGPDLDIKIQEAQTKIAQSKVTLYTQQVAMYTQEVNAYKMYLENVKDNPIESQLFFKKVELYKLVIKDTLLSIFTGLISVLIAYAFVQKGLAMLQARYEFKTAELKAKTQNS